MDLVDDIDPAGDLRGGIDRVVPEGPDLVHAVVGGGVDLQHVHTAAGVDGPAGGAAAAGAAVLEVGAVEGLGQNLGAGGLAGAPGPGEQIGVADAPGLQLGPQRLGHGVLPHHIVKGLGPVFSI